MRTLTYEQLLVKFNEDLLSYLNKHNSDKFKYGRANSHNSHTYHFYRIEDPTSLIFLFSVVVELPDPKTVILKFKDPIFILKINLEDYQLNNVITKINISYTHIMQERVRDFTIEQKQLEQELNLFQHTV